MCDYCDCRRMEPIAQLSEEHERLLALSAALKPHAEREERGLFLALAADEDLAATVPGLLDDHARLDSPGEFSPTAAVAFLDDLAAHILRGEHDVFPAAAQLLPAAAWDVVVAASSPSAAPA